MKLRELSTKTCCACPFIILCKEPEDADCSFNAAACCINQHPHTYVYVCMCFQKFARRAPEQRAVKYSRAFRSALAASTGFSLGPGLGVGGRWAPCLEVFMHIHIHTYVHTYIHTYVHTYIRMYIHRCMYMYTCMQVHMHLHIHACTHVCIYIYMIERLLGSI